MIPNTMYQVPNADLTFFKNFLDPKNEVFGTKYLPNKKKGFFQNFFFLRFLEHLAPILKTKEWFFLDLER
jgi:hypothetical protein